MVQDTDGRIPVISVVSSDTLKGAYVTKSIYSVLAAKMPNTALANSQGAWINDELVAVGDQRGFNGARVLLAATDCERAVLEIAESDISKSGFPVNSCDASIYLPHNATPIESIVKSFLDNVGDTLICSDKHFPVFKHHLQDKSKELFVVSQKCDLAQQEVIISTGATLFNIDGSSVRVASKNLDLTIPHIETDSEDLLFVAAALWAISRDKSIFSELSKLARNQ
jgi:hypothetical protein